MSTNPNPPRVNGPDANDGGDQLEIEQRYHDRTPESRAAHERALRSMPGGDSRSGTFFLPYPICVDRGDGCHVYDVDGHRYLDFLNNYGSLIHGHVHPEVTRAIAEQLRFGTVHGAASRCQARLAEEIVDRIPSVRRVRFSNSGTEAVMSAVRAARALTGRNRILKMEGGYHGSWEAVEVSVFPDRDAPTWPEGLPDGPGLSRGATAEVLVAPFNDLETTSRIIEEHHGDLAGVIVEPMMNAAGMIPGSQGFLRGLREVTRKHDTLLIFDEVITFRLARGGMQEVHDIEPDLTVLGKIIGGGLPVGAFGGSEEIMSQFDPRQSGYLFHSGTFNANPATMVAGLACLDLLTANEIGRINTLGDRLRRGLQSVLDDSGVRALVTGWGSLCHVHLAAPPIRGFRDAARGDVGAYRWIHLALLNHGVFTASRGFFSVSTAMGEADIDEGVIAFAKAVRDARSCLPDRNSQS